MNKATLQVLDLYRPLLETLNEVNGIPEGHAYIVYNSILNLDQFNSMISGLKKQKIITVKGHYIEKTEKFNEYFAMLAPIYQKIDNARGKHA